MQCDWLRELVQQNHVIPRYVGRDLEAPSPVNFPFLELQSTLLKGPTCLTMTLIQS